MLRLHSALRITQMFLCRRLFVFLLFIRSGASTSQSKQTKYLERVEISKGADPIVLRALQRMYKPFPPRPIKEPKKAHSCENVTEAKKPH